MRREVCKSSTNSMALLPNHIMTEIMSRLPIKEIIMCKCTCKSLRHLISSTDFVDLHFARAKPCILLTNQDAEFGHLSSRLMYLIEPSNMNNNISHIGDDCGCYVNELPEGVNLKLDTQLKIPIDYEKISRPRGGYAFVNSCNGFLCLFRAPKNFVVCNLVTNEYINVASPSKHVRWTKVSGGFGFCPKTKEYKVIRLLESTTGRTPMMSDIQTLGTDHSWRRLVDTPPTSRVCTIEHPIYVNGFIYWVSHDYSLLSFEFETERFKSLPMPRINLCSSVSMGLIGVRPSLYVNSWTKIEIWVIENLGGVDESLSKFASVIIDNILRPINWQLGSCCNTSCSKCESFSLLGCIGDHIVLYESKRQEFRRFKIHPNECERNAIYYTPSLFSLKDAVPGAYVNSISTGFVMPEEQRSPYLKEDLSGGFRHGF